MTTNNNNSQDEEADEIHETEKEIDPSPNSSHHGNNLTEPNNICNCRSARRTNKPLNTCHCNNRMDSCDDSFYQQRSYRNSSYDQNQSHCSHLPTEGARNRRDSLNLKDYQNLVMPISQLDASRIKEKARLEEGPLISGVAKGSQNRVVCKYCDGIFPAQTIQHHSLVCRSLKLYQARLWPAGFSFDEFLQRMNDQNMIAPPAEEEMPEPEETEEEEEAVENFAE